MARQILRDLISGFIDYGGVRHNCIMSIWADVSRETNSRVVRIQNIQCRMSVTNGAVSYRPGASNRTWGCIFKNVARTRSVSYEGTWTERNFTLDDVEMDLAIGRTMADCKVTGPDGEFPWVLSGIPDGIPPAITYASINGKREKLVRAYASVNGERQRLRKIYASVDGKRKLVYFG